MQCAACTHNGSRVGGRAEAAVHVTAGFRPHLLFQIRGQREMFPPRISAISAVTASATLTLVQTPIRKLRPRNSNGRRRTRRPLQARAAGDGFGVAARLFCLGCDDVDSTDAGLRFLENEALAL